MIHVNDTNTCAEETHVYQSVFDLIHIIAAIHRPEMGHYINSIELEYRFLVWRLYMIYSHIFHLIVLEKPHQPT